MRSLIWIILFSALLASCATTPTQTPAPSLSWKQREPKLLAIQHFQINGKIAVQTQHESASATLDWLQNKQNYTITLSGPLGATGLTLSGNQTNVTLTDANGKVYQSQNAEQLLAENWGFHLPVSFLRYWVRGLPSPNAPYQTTFDATHRLASLSQAGFIVEYLGYNQQGTLDLPKKISMRSATLKAKCVIYDWKIK